MKVPGPDHPITIEPFDGRVSVRFAGLSIADSRKALILREAAYPPVFYIPRDDVALASMSRTDRVTHCPYKGDASYYTVDAGGERVVDAAWSYEDPYPAMARIRGHLAFYGNKVDIQADTPGE